MEQKELIFQIDSKPVSINKSYVPIVKQNGRASAYLVKAAKQFKDDIGILSRNAMTRAKVDLIDVPFSMIIDYYFNPKNEGDVTNYDKALIDGMKGIVFTDDRLLGRNKDKKYLDAGILFECCLRKFFHSDKPKTLIKIVWYI